MIDALLILKGLPEMVKIAEFSNLVVRVADIMQSGVVGPYPMFRSRLAELVRVRGLSEPLCFGGGRDGAHSGKG